MSSTRTTVPGLDAPRKAASGNVEVDEQFSKLDEQENKLRERRQALNQKRDERIEAERRERVLAAASEIRTEIEAARSSYAAAEDELSTLMETVAAKIAVADAAQKNYRHLTQRAGVQLDVAGARQGEVEELLGNERRVERHIAFLQQTAPGYLEFTEVLHRLVDSYDLRNVRRASTMVVVLKRQHR